MSTLSPKDLAFARDMFNSTDANRDGLLDLNEQKMALQKMGFQEGVISQVVQKNPKMLNEHGFIRIIEVYNAKMFAMTWSQAYAFYDKQSSGKIARTHLRTILAEKMGESEADSLL